MVFVKWVQTVSGFQIFSYLSQWDYYLPKWHNEYQAVKTTANQPPPINTALPFVCISIVCIPAGDFVHPITHSNMFVACRISEVIMLQINLGFVSF